MDYYNNVRKIEDKLSEVLARENFLLRTHTSYPYTLNILQDQSPGAQMEIYATTDGNTSSLDAAIRFIFNLDGLVIRTDSRVIVADAFMNKIKGLAKKLHYAYLQAWFAEKMASAAVSTDLEDDDDETPDPAEDAAEDDGPAEDPFTGFFPPQPEDE